MRTRLLMLIAVAGLVACVTVHPVPTTPPTLTPSAAAGSSQTAVWIPRKQLFVKGTGGEGGRLFVWTTGSTHLCEGLRENVQSVLLKLGASANTLDVRDYGGCPERVGAEARFWVLVPTHGKAKNAVEAHWQTVEFNCEDLGVLKQRFLPFFSTRSLDSSDCAHGLPRPYSSALRPTIRFSVQVLKPPQELAASP